MDRCIQFSQVIKIYYYYQEMVADQKWRFSRRQLINYSANTFFIGMVCLLIFVPGAKSWVMKQMLNAGLFKANAGANQYHARPLLLSAGFADTDIKGNKISINALKGKKVFINFWATWCPPCRAEMPQLQNLYTATKENKNIVFLFISEDDQIDKAIEYLRDNNYDLPVSTTAGTVQAEIYSGTLPTTLVLDKQGTIVYKHEGIANYNTEKFKEFLNSTQ